VTVIDGSAFTFTAISSIEIEEGSISFRVLDGFLVDFEARLLVWVIGSPESIQVPASIEVLGRSCCAWNVRLRTVEFESDANLRSIDHFAFICCCALESICIPSSVETLYRDCFGFCSSLRSVTFGPESRLPASEREAFDDHS
jgi:hypothetical protein